MGHHPDTSAPPRTRRRRGVERPLTAPCRGGPRRRDGDHPPEWSCVPVGSDGRSRTVAPSVGGPQGVLHRARRVRAGALTTRSERDGRARIAKAARPRRTGWIGWVRVPDPSGRGHGGPRRDRGPVAAVVGASVPSRERPGTGAISWSSSDASGQLRRGRAAQDGVQVQARRPRVPATSVSHPSSLSRRPVVSKRTFQPNARRRAKKHGFRARMRTRAGRAVVRARRSRGRQRLSA